MSRLFGKRIFIPGQFTGAVTVESAKLLDDTWLLRVRDRQGELHDAYLTAVEAEAILASDEQELEVPVEANQFFLFIESARIKTAYDHDPHFAVSLSSETKSLTQFWLKGSWQGILGRDFVSVSLRLILPSGMILSQVSCK